MTGALPSALAPWSASLAALTPELATALGPLLRRLDALVSEHEPVTRAQGTPDGHGGLARTGRPDQLLPSEWLLADEFPDEFVRRLVDGELLHLAPEFTSPTPTGRTVVLADTGPEQAGAARLVQLAALLVLHRRAAARGTDLRVGILGDLSGTWLDGDLEDLLPAWLEARRRSDPTPEDVRHACELLEDGDRAWVLTSEHLAALLPAGTRTLTARPAQWDANGATGVEVHITTGRAAPTTALLPLPAPDIAVRALRGAAFRRAAPVQAVLPTGVRGGALPVFTTDSRTLLARGRHADVLLAVHLPGTARQATTVRARRHDLPGPALAAGRTGRRLIVLCARDRRLFPYVSGRRFCERGEYVVPDSAALGLDRDGLDALLTEPVLPLLVDDRFLRLPIAGRWWRIGPDGRAQDDGPVGRQAADLPYDRARDTRLYQGNLPAGAAQARHLLHGAGAVAWSTDRQTWDLVDRDGGHQLVTVREQADVIGLTHGAEGAALITVGRKDAVLRSAGANGRRTLARLSGGSGRPALHPTLPLIAVPKGPDRILVGDAGTGRIHHVIGSDQ
ncbi:hypothetical protein [Streptomyces sp. NRRL B-24484]|uniref:hypothetical protein n=1 Tax=Streptomyces sp. NRRL B-24484 TaxID=1463833 RepID=UPI000694FF46|nr:hypothetical protein [Streptomyces sp. NRRL B-24484]